jgi:hypothetical protein
LETKDVDLTRETQLTRNRAEQKKQSYLFKARLRGLEATGESMGQKQKAWGKSMGRGESLSQAVRRVPRPLLSRKRNNGQERKQLTEKETTNRNVGNKRC